MVGSLFVVGFPWEVLCDESVDRLELVGVVGDCEIKIAFPSINAEGGVGAPLVPGLPAELVWGAAVEVGGFVIDRVSAEAPGLDGVVVTENFIGEIAALRRRWMLWIGVLSGQTTSVRWAAVTSLRDREGIRLVHVATSGETELLSSSVVTRALLRPGASVGVLRMNDRLIRESWSRAIAGEEPPFAVELFQSAREAFQQQQLRVAILEMGSAVELLLWQRYKNLTKTTENKQLSLGQIVRELNKIGVLEHGPAFGIRALVDLRNSVAHHPDDGFYHGDCVRAFSTALELFQVEYPSLVCSPAPDGPHLIGT